MLSTPALSSIRSTPDGRSTSPRTGTGRAPSCCPSPRTAPRREPSAPRTAGSSGVPDGRPASTWRPQAGRSARFCVDDAPVGPSGPEMGQNGPFWQEGSGRDDRGHRTWRRTRRCIRRNPGMGMETRRGFRSIIRRRWRWVSIGLGIGAVLGCMYGVLDSADCLQRGLQLPRVGIPGLGRRHGDSGGRDVLLPGLEAGEGPGRCGMRVGPGTPRTEGQAGARQRESRNPGGCGVRTPKTEKACRQPAF